MSPQTYEIQDRILKHRRILIFFYHLFAVALANYLAFQIRFDGAVPERFSVIMWQSVLLMLIVRLPLFALFGWGFGFGFRGGGGGRFRRSRRHGAHEFVGGGAVVRLVSQGADEQLSRITALS